MHAEVRLPVGLEAEAVSFALVDLILPVVQVQAVLVWGPRSQALVHVGGGDLKMGRGGGGQGSENKSR